MSLTQIVYASRPFGFDASVLDAMRITPSPEHSDTVIDKLLNALSEIWSHCELARLEMAA